MNQHRKQQVLKYLHKKNITLSAKEYLVHAMGAMAQGLFASLLIGTICSTLGNQFPLELFELIGFYGKNAVGAAIGTAIAYSLKAPPLVLFSAAAAASAGYDMGGPAGAYAASVVATEFGKLVSKETKIDMIITPATTIAAGCLTAQFISPAIGAFMNSLGSLIQTGTEIHPFFMSIIVSVLIGLALTLPISSAAICIALSLGGLAGGAATAGCCAHMIGFAVMSFHENGIDGLFAQGLGTSMLQMGNILKNPRIAIPPVLASAITGPVAVMVFKLQNIPAASGMGTCGLVGPIGIYTAMEGGSLMWIGIILVCFLLPALLSFLFCNGLTRLGWIKPGDLKLEL